MNQIRGRFEQVIDQQNVNDVLTDDPLYWVPKANGRRT